MTKLYMYQELVDKIESLKEEKIKLINRIHELEVMVDYYKSMNRKCDKINVEMLKNFIANERLSDEQRDKLHNILIVSE